MKYEFIRNQSGVRKSFAPLRDEVVEFESEEVPKVKIGEPFSFSTAPRDFGTVRIIQTSTVTKIYPRCKCGIVVKFDTESGSTYTIKIKRAKSNENN